MKFVCVLATLALASAGPLVEVEQGWLEGGFATSVVSGAQYVAFRGIPYALAPIGPLRFKPPLPPFPWDGIRQATEEGSVCIQLASPDSTTDCITMKASTLQAQPCRSYSNQNENCLFLNVYYNQRSDNVTLKPVMVWIHGGGYLSESGNSEDYGPDFLLEKDVVIVTFNYRLGAFGFLALDDMEISGNMGLKDQVMALKWVQKNIAKFGGDPSKVTIFGQGTGAACVSAHLLSPMSKGLFSASISESGNILNYLAFGRGVLYQNSRTLVWFLGCSKSTGRLACLQNVTANTIASQTVGLMLTLIVEFKLGLLFTPTAEHLDAPDAFLTDDPIEYYKKGLVADVPCLIGVNSEEADMLYPVTQTPFYWLTWGRHASTYIPMNLDPRKYDPDDLVRKIKAFYFGKQTVSNATVQIFLQMVTDIAWVNGDRQTLKWQAVANEAATFSYQFNYNGTWNFGKTLAGVNRWPGASHYDETGYLWYKGFQTMGNVTWKTSEWATSVRLVTMWTNFAKFGNPTPDSSDGRLIPWPAYTTDKHSCLKIDTELSVMPDLEKKSSLFWDDIYAQYSYD